jgi:hypothetical protein
MKTFPKKIYVGHDPNADANDDLLAWADLKSPDDGKIGVYVLESELEKRTATEVRRKGKREWRKP